MELKQNAKKLIYQDVWKIAAVSRMLQILSRLLQAFTDERTFLIFIVITFIFAFRFYRAAWNADAV